METLSRGTGGVNLGVWRVTKTCRVVRVRVWGVRVGGRAAVRWVLVGWGVVMGWVLMGRGARLRWRWGIAVGWDVGLMLEIWRRVLKRAWVLVRGGTLGSIGCSYWDRATGIGGKSLELLF